MDSPVSQQPSATSDPPKLWHATQFRVFQEHFSADEQHQLLHEDAMAQTGVCAILAVLIAIGVLLAIVSVSIIASLSL